MISLSVCTSPQLVAFVTSGREVHTEREIIQEPAYLLHRLHQQTSRACLVVQGLLESVPARAHLANCSPQTRLQDPRCVCGPGASRREALRARARDAEEVSEQSRHLSSLRLAALTR